MLKAIRNVFNTIRQRSVRSGLNALAVVLGLYFGPAEIEAIIALIGAAYGAYDLLRREHEKDGDE